MADATTNAVADYVERHGVKISAISRKAGIPDGILRRSLSKRERSLRADEFLGICGFLGMEPFDFKELPTNNAS